MIDGAQKQKDLTFKKSKWLIWWLHGQAVTLILHNRKINQPDTLSLKKIPKHSRLTRWRPAALISHPTHHLVQKRVAARKESLADRTKLPQVAD